MYEEYYGFTQPPFALTPDPKFLYRSESHDSALQQVWQAIRRKEGFIVLAGDIGTGKTTLCRTILEQFDANTFTALILDPFLSQEDLLREILLSYGVVSRDALRTGRLASATRHELIRTLHDFLLSLEPIHGSAVLIIDEAQHLAPDVLEEIRILSNLETNDRKLLLIVLVGQLNLLDVLRDPKLRQLDQRISIRCVLQPLTREATDAYLSHRLAVAGASRPVAFTTAAIDLVHEISGGVPRVINLLADRSLMAAAEAKSDAIDAAHVRAASARLGLTSSPPPAAPAHTSAPADTPRARSPRALRLTVAALVTLTLLTAGVYSLVLGTPLDMFRSRQLPTVPPPPGNGLVIPAPSGPPAPESLPTLTPPDIESGAFSVIAGTFTTPRDAERAVQQVLAKGLPVYAVDLRLNGAAHRRVMVGRFGTREEALKAQASLAAAFPEARVVYGWFERVP
jgi:type II secretory pathway predicted ATPase ExeA